MDDIGVQAAAYGKLLVKDGALIRVVYTRMQLRDALASGPAVKDGPHAPSLLSPASGTGTVRDKLHQQILCVELRWPDKALDDGSRGQTSGRAIGCGW